MIEVNANLGDLNDVDLTTKLPSNNDLLAYNSNTSKWVPIISSGKLEPQYVVKDAWSTTGTHNFSENMHNFYIQNTGTSDITFTINSIAITVKASEEFEDVFDPFTSMSISGTSTFTANVSALKTGSSNPQYTVKDYFSGSSNVTRQYSGNVYGLVVSNDDATNSLTYTVNGITLTLPAGDVLERFFNSFTQLSINSTTPYRAYAKSSFQTVITGSTADTVVPVVTASPNGGLFNATQSVILIGTDNSGEAVTIYYTLDGSTPTVASAVYSAPISISATTTIKYFGKDPSSNASAVQTASYTITAATPAYVTSGLVAYLDANGASGTTWNDLSVNGHNGKLTNYAMTASSGWNANALVNDGVDDCVLIPNNAQMKTYPLSLEFSVSFASNTGTQMLYDAKYELASTNGIALLLDLGKVSVFGTPSSISIDGSTTLPIATKKHIVVTINGTSIKIYIDGTLSQTKQPLQVDANTVVNGAQNIRLFRRADGAWPSSVTCYLFRQYNKELTQAEITQNYNTAH